MAADYLELSDMKHYSWPTSKKRYFWKNILQA